MPQTKQVLELIHRLREHGLGVVVISHNLANVFEVADRIFVLRLGRTAGDFDAEDDHRGARRRRDHRCSARTRTATAERSSGNERDAGPTPTVAPRRRPEGVRSETLRRFIQGDLASLRVVFGLAVIWIDLPVAERPLPLGREPDQPDAADHRRRADLGRRRLVLLLGEIDLSVGAVSGLAAAVMAVLNVKHGWDPYLAIAAGDRGRARRSGSSRGSSSAASASRPSSSRWPACSPGRARCCRCSARPARSTSPTRRSSASPTPSTPTPSAGSSPRW